MEIAPPDSAYGWAVALSASTAQFVSLGSINCFGVFFPPLMAEYKVGNAELALVVSLANLVAPMIGTAAGNMADHYGARIMIFIAALCQFGAFFISSMVPHFSILFASFGVLAGIAGGCTISPSLGAVGQWFEEKRSTAMGIAYAGAGLGTVVLPTLATFLLENHDWRYTFRFLSGWSVFVVIASVIMKRRVHHEYERLQSFSIYDILTTRGFAVLFAVGFFFSYGFFIPIVHIAMYSRNIGLTAIQAGYSLALLGLTTTVGNVVWGTIADRFGNMPVFRACHGVSGVMLCVWPLCTTFPHLLLFASVAGFFNGGCVTCYPAIAAEQFPPEKLSGAISLIYTYPSPQPYNNLGLFSYPLFFGYRGFGLGSLVGPVVTGLIIDFTGGYLYAAELGGLAFFCALAVASFLRTPRNAITTLGKGYLCESEYPNYGTANEGTELLSKAA